MDSRFEPASAIAVKTLVSKVRTDPFLLSGDYNLFRYCHNDPLDLTDPMGLHGQYPYTDDIDEFFYSVSHAGIRATFDAQSKFGNTTGKFAVEQGKLATTQYGQNPNAGEAVRHEVWQSELARKYGEQAAKAVGDAHEKFKSRDPDDSRRDQYHNQRGRENGTVGRSKNENLDQARQESLRRAKRDWETGRAATDQRDHRLFEGTAPTKPLDASRIDDWVRKQGILDSVEFARSQEYGGPMRRDQ